MNKKGLVVLIVFLFLLGCAVEEEKYLEKSFEEIENLFKSGGRGQLWDEEYKGRYVEWEGTVGGVEVTDTEVFVFVKQREESSDPGEVVMEMERGGIGLEKGTKIKYRGKLSVYSLDGSFKVHLIKGEIIS